MQRNYSNYNSMNRNQGNMMPFNMNAENLSNLLAVASNLSNMQGNIGEQYNSNNYSDNMNYNNGFERAMNDSSWRSESNMRSLAANNLLKRSSDSFRSGTPLKRLQTSVGIGQRNVVRPMGRGGIVRTGSAVVRTGSGVVRTGSAALQTGRGAVRTAANIVRAATATARAATGKPPVTTVARPGTAVTKVFAHKPDAANAPYTMPAEVMQLSKTCRKKYRIFISQGLTPKDALKKIQDHVASVAKNAKITEENKEMRKLVIYNGMPGAVDDPLRKRLNGGGIKWYIKYLSDGYGSRVARLKAEERMNERALICETKEDSIQAKSLKELYGKRYFPIPSFCAEDYLRVAIRAKKEDKKDLVPLTDVQLMELEDAILEELLKNGNPNIAFESSTHYPDNGVLVVQCSNETATYWLLEVLPANFKAWTGPTLQFGLEKLLNRYHTITLTLDRTMDKTTDELFKLLEIQNAGLFTHKWKVKCEEKNGDEITLEIFVDHASAMFILNNGCEIKYRFNSVIVQGLDNIDDNFLEGDYRELFEDTQEEQHAEENGHGDEDQEQGDEEAEQCANEEDEAN